MLKVRSQVISLSLNLPSGSQGDYRTRAINKTPQASQLRRSLRENGVRNGKQNYATSNKQQATAPGL